MRGRSATLGRRVRAPDERLEGIAVDIAEDGAVVIETDAGARERIVAGDVWLA